MVVRSVSVDSRVRWIERWDRLVVSSERSSVRCIRSNVVDHGLKMKHRQTPMRCELHALVGQMLAYDRELIRSRWSPSAFQPIGRKVRVRSGGGWHEGSPKRLPVVIALRFAAEAAYVVGAWNLRPRHRRPSGAPCRARPLSSRLPGSRFRSRAARDRDGADQGRTPQIGPARREGSRRRRCLFCPACHWARNVAEGVMVTVGHRRSGACPQKQEHLPQEFGGVLPPSLPFLFECPQQEIQPARQAFAIGQPAAIPKRGDLSLNLPLRRSQLIEHVKVGNRRLVRRRLRKLDGGTASWRSDAPSRLFATETGGSSYNRRRMCESVLPSPRVITALCQRYPWRPWQPET